MKRKRKAKKATADYGAAAAQERHGEIVRLEETMQAGVLRARVLTTRPLDRYHHKGMISDMQWFAGDKFSRDWHIGCQGARVTGLYDVRIVGGAVDNERMVDARERVKHALRDVGRQLRPVIVHVCGLDLSAGDWARLYGEPKRAGITVLRLALNALDDTYAGLKRFGTN